MGSTFLSLHYHVVFSTKERRPLIPPPLRERLWPFLGGIAISKAMQLMKGGSSKWVHETFPEHRHFRWQVKYGAFGVSVSLLHKTIQYLSVHPGIRNDLTPTAG